MKTAAINFKVEENIKRQAREFSKLVGVPLGSILNAYLREVVKSKRVSFSTASIRDAYGDLREIADNLTAEEREKLRKILNTMRLKEHLNGIITPDGTNSYLNN